MEASKKGNEPKLLGIWTSKWTRKGNLNELMRNLGGHQKKSSWDGFQRTNIRIFNLSGVKQGI